MRAYAPRRRREGRKAGQRRPPKPGLRAQPGGEGRREALAGHRAGEQAGRQAGRAVCVCLSVSVRQSAAPCVATILLPDHLNNLAQDVSIRRSRQRWTCDGAGREEERPPPSDARQRDTCNERAHRCVKWAGRPARRHAQGMRPALRYGGLGWAAAITRPFPGQAAGNR